MPEAYVHRIGRTARAGADGSAVAFCADDERNLLKDIEKVSRQRIPSFDRRNDRHLGAATAVMPDVGKADRADTRGSQPHRGQHAQKRNRNHGGANGGGHRHEGAPARHDGDKPAFKGPSRGNGGGSGRGRGGGAGRSGGTGGSRSGAPTPGLVEPLTSAKEPGRPADRGPSLLC